ncbi:unnamed protein product [marine sediment metagenome]|uniref:Uncharacterized protein n=1 Tax=marine sediment metagenome TaxID=412755 RepID=X1A937_9ZZZZ
MIANLIGGFISIIVGTSLIGPVSTEVAAATASGSNLSTNVAWGASVLKLVPGFFALAILGIGVAVTYTSLRQAGIV